MRDGDEDRDEKNNDIIYDKLQVRPEIAMLLAKSSSTQCFAPGRYCMNYVGQEEDQQAKPNASCPPVASLAVGQKDDSDAILAAANIIGSLGSNFRVEDRYTRLYILMSKGNFEMLLQRDSELGNTKGGDNGVAEKVKAENENGSGSRSGADRDQLALRYKFIYKSKVVSGIEAAWGAKKTEDESEKGWEHFLGVKRYLTSERGIMVRPLSAIVSDASPTYDSFLRITNTPTSPEGYTWDLVGVNTSGICNEYIYLPLYVCNTEKAVEVAATTKTEVAVEKAGIMSVLKGVFIGGRWIIVVVEVNESLGVLEYDGDGGCFVWIMEFVTKSYLKLKNPPRDISMVLGLVKNMVCQVWVSFLDDDVGREKKRHHKSDLSCLKNVRFDPFGDITGGSSLGGRAEDILARSCGFLEHKQWLIQLLPLKSFAAPRSSRSDVGTFFLSFFLILLAATFFPFDHQVINLAAFLLVVFLSFSFFLLLYFLSKRVLAIFCLHSFGMSHPLCFASALLAKGYTFVLDALKPPSIERSSDTS
ncbi:tryptophan aminotransferase-related protein 3-like protein [Tanacetum coccineum]